MQSSVGKAMTYGRAGALQLAVDGGEANAALVVGGAVGIVTDNRVDDRAGAVTARVPKTEQAVDHAEMQWR